MLFSKEELTNRVKNTYAIFGNLELVYAEVIDFNSSKMGDATSTVYSIKGDTVTEVENIKNAITLSNEFILRTRVDNERSNIVRIMQDSIDIKTDVLNISNNIKTESCYKISDELELEDSTDYKAVIIYTGTNSAASVRIYTADNFSMDSLLRIEDYGIYNSQYTANLDITTTETKITYEVKGISDMSYTDKALELERMLDFERFLINEPDRTIYVNDYGISHEIIQSKNIIETSLSLHNRIISRSVNKDGKNIFTQYINDGDIDYLDTCEKVKSIDMLPDEIQDSFTELLALTFEQIEFDEEDENNSMSIYYDMLFSAYTFVLRYNMVELEDVKYYETAIIRIIGNEAGYIYMLNNEAAQIRRAYSIFVVDLKNSSIVVDNYSKIDVTPAEMIFSSNVTLKNFEFIRNNHIDSNSGAINRIYYSGPELTIDLSYTYGENGYRKVTVNSLISSIYSINDEFVYIRNEFGIPEKIAIR